MREKKGNRLPQKREAVSTDIFEEKYARYLIADPQKRCNQRISEQNPLAVLSTFALTTYLNNSEIGNALRQEEDSRFKDLRGRNHNDSLNQKKRLRMIQKSPSPFQILNPVKVEEKKRKMNKSMNEKTVKKDLWTLKFLREKKLADFKEKTKLKKNQGAVYESELQKIKNSVFLKQASQNQRISRKYENVNKSYIFRESKDLMHRSPSTLINRSLSPQLSNPSIEWAPVDDERREALQLLFHKRSFKSRLLGNERNKLPYIN